MFNWHILLTLAPTPVFYFMSNCMGNILLTALDKWNEVGGSYFYGIVYWPVGHNSQCYKTYLAIYKVMWWCMIHTSITVNIHLIITEYIYFTVRGVIFLWYGILTREPGEPFTSSNQLQLLNQLRFTTKFTT